MTDISLLRAEIARWEEDLAALDEDRTAEGWTEPEKLLFTVQRTIATYRRQVLPRITADRAPTRPAPPHSQPPEAFTDHNAIIADEINQLVDRLDELRSDLVRSGQTAQLHHQTTQTLAALRALGRLVQRLGREVDTPRPTTLPTREQPDPPTPAAHTYDKDLRQ